MENSLCLESISVDSQIENIVQIFYDNNLNIIYIFFNNNLKIVYANTKDNVFEILFNIKNACIPNFYIDNHSNNKYICEIFLNFFPILLEYFLLYPKEYII